MDTYLPADFHQLHAGAAADWRDVPSVWAREYPASAAAAANEECERINRCADPLWRVF